MAWANASLPVSAIEWVRENRFDTGESRGGRYPCHPTGAVGAMPPNVTPLNPPLEKGEEAMQARCLRYVFMTMQAGCLRYEFMTRPPCRVTIPAEYE